MKSWTVFALILLGVLAYSDGELPDGVPPSGDSSTKFVVGQKEEWKPDGSKSTTIKVTKYTTHKLDNGKTENCPISCPEGWATFGGLTDHCYLLPTQPVIQDTFWGWQKRCKDREPTSYIAVVNDASEQLIGSVVVIQYAPSWFAELTNVYLWLNGYTDGKGKWKLMDNCTDCLNSPFYALTSVSTALAGDKPGICMGAEAKTLGLWQTYGCDNKAGTAICEMPMRRVCPPEKEGGNIPISGISLSQEALKSLFTQGLTFPYFEQVFKNPLSSAGSFISDGLSKIGSSVSNFFGR